MMYVGWCSYSGTATILSEVEELKMLSEQSQKMRNDLEMIQGRIGELMKNR